MPAGFSRNQGRGPTFKGERGKGREKEWEEKGEGGEKDERKG